MESVVSFNPLRPAGFVNLRGGASIRGTVRAEKEERAYYIRIVIWVDWENTWPFEERTCPWTISRVSGEPDDSCESGKSGYFSLLLSLLNIRTNRGHANRTSKSSYVEFGQTAIPTPNNHISKTKRDF